MQLHITQSVADDIQALADAIDTLRLQLVRQHLYGMAALILEVLAEPGIEAVHIAVTEQQTPTLFGMPGERRSLLCSVTLEPGSRLLAVPDTVFQASVLSEGAFTARRSDPDITKLLAMAQHNRESAHLQLARLMQPCFQAVANTSSVDVLTER